MARRRVRRRAERRSAGPEGGLQRLRTDAGDHEPLAPAALPRGDADRAARDPKLHGHEFDQREVGCIVHRRGAQPDPRHAIVQPGKPGLCGARLHVDLKTYFMRVPCIHEIPGFHAVQDRAPLPSPAPPRPAGRIRRFM